MHWAVTRLAHDGCAVNLDGDYAATFSALAAGRGVVPFDRFCRWAQLLQLKALTALTSAAASASPATIAATSWSVDAGDSAGTSAGGTAGAPVETGNARGNHRLTTMETIDAAPRASVAATYSHAVQKAQGEAARLREQVGSRFA